MTKILIELDVNGETHELAVAPNRLLLEVLREDLRLTAAKRACDDSSCGACTVLADGLPVLACASLAVCAEGSRIDTLEGVARDGTLHPLQEGFMTEGGSQCGYCTPGFIMSAKHLLDTHPDPSPDDVTRAIAGNLCRCTGYVQIHRSIRKAIGQVKEARRDAESS